MIFFRRLKEAAVAQLTQGVSAEKLALSTAVAVSVGVFPLLGFTTALCVGFGWGLRLNQPFLQLVNYGMTPFQLLLMPLFLRAGESMFFQPELPFSLAAMMQSLSANPAHFLSHYGRAGLLAVAAWGILAPLGGALVYFAVAPVWRKLERQMRGQI